MRPPSLARLLVRLSADAEDRDFLLADLDERFRELARTRGPRAARRWYRSQAWSAALWALRPDLAVLHRTSWTGALGDLRSGVRMLARNPLYAVGVAGTLGLGLAAAALTFAVAWNVWLAPMPYPDPDRVLRLYELAPPPPAADPAEADAPAPPPGPESRRQPLSVTLLEDLRAHEWTTLSAVSAALPPSRGADWIREGEARSTSWVTLSPEGFGILGIVPTVGRLPAEVETEVLLSERFWRTAFAADPGVLGSSMVFDWGSATIVGVAPVPAGYPDAADLVYMSTWLDEDVRDHRFVEAIARLRPGFSIEQAKAELNAFLVTLAEAHPEHRGWGIDAVPLADALVGPFREVMALLLAAGATFLLLAGVNVLGLVAARRVDGRRDRSVRLALGASEARLLRASLAEALVLAMLGAVAASVVAYTLVGPLRALVPDDVPRLGQVVVSGPLLGAVLVAGLTLGVVIGLSGGLVSRGGKPSVGRTPGWRAVGAGGGRALVVGQVALTSLLTAGGAAMLHRVTELRAMDLGFEPEAVSMTGTVLRMPDPGAVLRAVLDGLEARGVPAAGAYNTPMAAEDVPRFGMRPDAASDEVFYEWRPVTEGYFSVAGTDLLAGRVFAREDDGGAAPVAIVSEAFVERYFPPGTLPEQVVGRVLSPLFFGGDVGPTVVGVAESTRHEGPDEPLVPEVYTPYAQFTIDPVSLLVRGEPEEVARAVSEVLERVTPDQRWTPLTPYRSRLREWFAPLRLQLGLIGVLGALGLLLVSLGLYSLMAWQVSVRRRELGVRKAVGASDGRLMGMVLASGILLALPGAALGLLAWYRLLPWTGRLVEGIGEGGWVVPLAVVLVVGGSCLLATFVPALRAMRVDPVVTLGSE